MIMDLILFLWIVGAIGFAFWMMNREGDD